MLEISSPSATRSDSCTDPGFLILLLRRVPPVAALADGHFANQKNAPSRSFHKNRECAGLTDDDLRVEVPSDQSRSGQVGTESCERRGNAGFEA